MYYDKMGELLYEDEIFSRLILDDGSETKYLVSNYGRVWSEVREIYLSINIDKRSGRKRFSIFVNGKQITIYLARAIAMAFLGPGPGMDADHIDEDFTNDVLENIQWLTPSENKRKTHREGKIKYNKISSEPGDESNNHVYTEDDIHKVCKMMEEGYDMKYISETTDVSMAVIQSVKSGKNWTIVSKNYDINNVKPTKPIKLNEDVNNFIKQKLIEGFSNKDIKKMVYDNYGIKSTYSSITNHKRRLKKKV